MHPKISSSSVASNIKSFDFDNVTVRYLVNPTNDFANPASYEIRMTKNKRFFLVSSAYPIDYAELAIIQKIKHVRKPYAGCLQKLREIMREVEIAEDLGMKIIPYLQFRKKMLAKVVSFYQNKDFNACVAEYKIALDYVEDELKKQIPQEMKAA